jgi:hypothetical protein
MDPMHAELYKANLKLERKGNDVPVKKIQGFLLCPFWKKQYRSFPITYGTRVRCAVAAFVNLSSREGT